MQDLSFYGLFIFIYKKMKVQNIKANNDIKEI